MANRKRDSLAKALEALKKLQDAGSCFAIKGAEKLGAANTKTLLENGFLEEVIRGWYIPSTPAYAGTTVTWYASFWGFVAAYCRSRFGEDWVLTPEESLSVWGGVNIISEQVVVQAKHGSNSVQRLKHGTSIFNFTTRIPERIVKEPVYGLNVYPLDVALLRCSPDFFLNHSEEVRACLNSLEAGESLRAAVVDFGGEAYANRLIGALRAVGRNEIADSVFTIQEECGRKVVPVNPCERTFERIYLPERSPSAARIRMMWAKMREMVLAISPVDESIMKPDADSVLKEIDAEYVADSYHSLSIEGYKVTKELIRKIRDGEWNPKDDSEDGDRRNALAASGYYRAYRKVREAVARILGGAPAGEVIAEELETWHRELFMPCVDAGLMSIGDLSGYRRTQVYIAGSRYTPPSAVKVPDAMDAFLDLLRTESEPLVRAILGHFFFVHIHPYADGNGRSARFIMNAALVSGGFGWKVIPVERRQEYMAALETASIEGDVRSFARFVIG